MSFVSGRDVDGSVEGGENTSSTAGVFGGNASSWISATGVGSGMCKGRIWVVLRETEERLRAGLGRTGGFFSSLSEVEERCFFGDMTGSVFTGSGKF